MTEKPPWLYFISGMWCTTCSKTITSGLRKLASVEAAEINFASKLLTVKVRAELSNQASTDEEIRQVVEQMGFAIKRQPAGWIQSFYEDLRREHSQVVSTSLLAVVGFLAMWSSMIAFSGYLGGLETEEYYLVSLLSTAVGVPAILLGITPFLKAGVRALWSGRLLTLDLFIAFGGLSAISISLLNLASGSAHSYADSASMVLLVLLLAKILETRLSGYISGQLLQSLNPADSSVEVLHGKSWRRRELAQVRRGSLVRFEAGDTISLDGKLSSPEATVNSHLLNGEDSDLYLQQEDMVLAGSIARTALELEVSQPLGVRTIDRWAESAFVCDNGSHAYSRLLRLIEGRLTMAAFAGASLCALVAWLREGHPGAALEAFFVGALIFCPCLFAGIIPLTKQMACLALGRMGIVLQRADCLFDLNAIDKIYLDKTGTLEAVDSFYLSFCNKTEQRVQEILGQLAKQAPHPVLAGLGKNCARQEQRLETRELPGYGVEALHPCGDSLVVGRPEFVCRTIGESVVPQRSYPLVAFKGRIVGTIISKAEFNERSTAALNELLELFPESVSIELLSGDPKIGAGANFISLHPTRVFYRGNLSPQEKSEAMEENALFAGDGLNDTLALAKARVSCRLGQRIQAPGPSDIQLLGGDLSGLVETVKYARRYLRVLKQTAFLALSYNVVALSLALSGFFTPLGAVLAMLLSLSLLTLSALRLLKT